MNKNTMVSLVLPSTMVILVLYNIYIVTLVLFTTRIALKDFSFMSIKGQEPSTPA